jgi:hypothetical protein
MAMRLPIAAALIAALSLHGVLGGWNGGGQQKKFNNGGRPSGRKLSTGGTSGHGVASGGSSHYWWQDMKPFSNPTNGKAVVLGGGQQHGQHVSTHAAI